MSLIILRKALCSDFTELDFLPSGGKETGACPGQTDSLHMDTSMRAGQLWQGRGASGMNQTDRAVTPSSDAWQKFWHLHPSFRPYKYNKTIRFNQKYCCYISHYTTVKNPSAIKEYLWQYFWWFFCDFPYCFRADNVI